MLFYTLSRKGNSLAYVTRPHGIGRFRQGKGKKKVQGIVKKKGGIPEKKIVDTAHIVRGGNMFDVLVIMQS